MKEYGGYIEFENYHGNMLHDRAISLNCGRNALAYLCEAKKIKKLYLPYFLCSSVPNLCDKIGVEYGYYHINEKFEPIFNKALGENEWLYIRKRIPVWVRGFRKSSRPGGYFIPQECVY